MAKGEVPNETGQGTGTGRIADVRGRGEHLRRGEERSGCGWFATALFSEWMNEVNEACPGVQGGSHDSPSPTRDNDQPDLSAKGLAPITLSDSPSPALRRLHSHPSSLLSQLTHPPLVYIGPHTHLDEESDQTKRKRKRKTKREDRERATRMLCSCTIRKGQA